MIGIDLVKISRIENLIAKFGEKGLRRFLSEAEIESSKNRVETVAGYWAVKEAVSKSLKTGIGKELSFHEIEIYKDSKNAPFVKVPQRFGISEIAVSITHDGDYAIAVATYKK